MVFLHGLLVDGELWRKVTPLLQGDARCIAPDLPLGSHRTAMNADADLTPASVARLVGDLLAALDLEDVTLVGNDTGGAISQLVALDHGERVGRLVLTNCDCFEVFPPKEFVPMVKAARVPGALFAAVQPMRSAKARRSPLAYGWLAHEIPDEVTGAWVQPFLEDADIRRDAAAFMRAIDKATMLDAAARLPSLKIPSLVVWGQDDRFFSPSSASGWRRRSAPASSRSPARAPSSPRTSPKPSPTSSAASCARARGAGVPEPGRGPDSHSAGNTPGGRRPGPLGEQPHRMRLGRAPGEERAHVADRQHQPRGRGDLQVGGVDRLAAEDAVGQPAVDAVEVAGQRAQVGADGALLRAVEAALDADDDRGQGAAPRASGGAAAVSRPGS